MNISQSQRTDLIEKVAYLEHEAEALKYVIDSIPYDKKTKSGRSVLEALLYLDHAQQHYFRKVIEDAHKSVRPININSYVKPSDSFEVSEDDKDVQKVLYKIAKHRVSLINLLHNISLIDWEREVSMNKTNITLYQFVSDMTHQERVILKEIADLINSYQNEAG